MPPPLPASPSRVFTSEVPIGNWQGRTIDAIFSGGRTGSIVPSPAVQQTVNVPPVTLDELKPQLEDVARKFDYEYQDARRLNEITDARIYAPIVPELQENINAAANTIEKGYYPKPKNVAPNYSYPPGTFGEWTITYNFDGQPFTTTARGPFDASWFLDTRPRNPRQMKILSNGIISPYSQNAIDEGWAVEVFDGFLMFNSPTVGTVESQFFTSVPDRVSNLRGTSFAPDPGSEPIENDPFPGWRPLDTPTNPLHPNNPTNQPLPSTTPTANKPPTQPQPGSKPSSNQLQGKPLADPVDAPVKPPADLPWSIPLAAPLAKPSNLPNGNPVSKALPAPETERKVPPVQQPNVCVDPCIGKVQRNQEVMQGKLDKLFNTLTGLLNLLNTGLLATINNKLGPQTPGGLSGLLGAAEFPVTVPASLLSRGGVVESTTTITNMTQLIAWFIQQFDGLMGQWEIPVNVQDGDKVQALRLPNLAEATAEQMGLLLNLTAAVSTLTNISMRSLTEAGAAHKEAAIAHMYGRENAQFLGYEGKEVAVDLPMAFKPGGINLEDVLINQFTKIRGWQNVDKHDLKFYLHEFLTASSIIRSVYWKRLDAKGDLQQQVKDYVKEADFVGKTSTLGDDDFDAYLKRVEDGFTGEPGISDSQNPYGRDKLRRPRIRRLGKRNPDGTSTS